MLYPAPVPAPALFCEGRLFISLYLRPENDLRFSGCCLIDMPATLSPALLTPSRLYAASEQQAVNASIWRFSVP